MRLLSHRPSPRKSPVSTRNTKSASLLLFPSQNLGDKLHRLAQLDHQRVRAVEQIVDLMLKRLDRTHCVWLVLGLAL